MIFSGLDPVQEGFIKSFPRPGGNITGVSRMLAETDAKRLELIKEIPAVSRSSSPNAATEWWLPDGLPWRLFTPRTHARLQRVGSDRRTVFGHARNRQIPAAQFVPVAVLSIPLASY